eukprot:8295522-Alexandrium_andersonii.AAC.1
MGACAVQRLSCPAPPLLCLLTLNCPALDREPIVPRKSTAGTRRARAFAPPHLSEAAQWRRNGPRRGWQPPRWR